MSDPDKRIKQAVEESIEVLAEHIDPGAKHEPAAMQDFEATLNKLSETLDNDEVKDAIEASDEKREAAQQSARSQKEDHNGGRPDETRTSRPQPHQHKRRMGA